MKEQLSFLAQKIGSLEQQASNSRERLSYYESMDEEHKKNLE